MNILSQCISPIDITSIDLANSDLLHNIYSKFTFFNLNLSSICPNDSSNLKNYFEDSLVTFLNQFKFITYNYIDISRNKQCLPTNQIFKQGTDTPFNLNNGSICAESNCFIIKSIDKNFLTRILKKTECKIINAEDGLVSTEVASFYEYISQSINNNEFLQTTIHSILAYLIRRYFCPTYYFNDPSFFYFDPQNKDIDIENKKKFSKILFSINHVQYRYNSRIYLNEPKDKKNQIYEFQKSDFIILRTIHSNQFAVFYLVFHIKSLYIFMMQVPVIDGQTTLFQRKINFCKNFSHRCLNRFYGFLKENNETVGFIYEFLTNGSLLEYLRNHQASDIFSYMTINRIFQGIEYIHSKNYIHRDLKPDNILLNHDNIPYICDFDSIRNINKENKEKDENIEHFTHDIGSNLYVSPEQYKGDIKYSYPTDIYSFGLIIYFIFERKNWTNSTCPCSIYKQKVDEDYKLMKNVTKNIQDLYLSCVKYDQNDRCSLNEIKHILFNDAKSVDYFENFLLKETNEIKISEIIQYIYENTFIILEYTKSLDDMFIYVYICFLLLNCQLRVPLSPNKFKINQDYPISTDYFVFLEKNFDSNIFLMLGTFYEKGEDVKLDYLKARKYYILAARKLNIKAILNLGYLYINGLGVLKDEKIAMRCFEIAAQYNDPDGLLNLGNMYKNNRNILNNYIKAKECYERSAKQNNSIALFELGNLYMDGQGIKKDYSKARECYELSANLNNSDSLYELGNIFYYGLGVDQNFFKAKNYYEKAASQNNSDALLNLGIMHEFGYGAELNYKKAIEYYELAAKLNNPNAFNNLGILYVNGKGVLKNSQKAIQLFELGAKQNNPMSFYLLGHFYFNNFDGKRDYFKAKKYYEKAAVYKNRFALNNLGYLYLNGFGVEQNFSKAAEYFKLAAELNDPYSLLNLGCLYKNGIGVEKDLEKALFCYESAAKLNDPEGLLQLGILYLNGHIVKQDLFKGIQYIGISADLNNPSALYHLACIYEYGVYFEPNLNKAIEYYTKSITSITENVALYIQRENAFVHQFIPNSYKYISNNNLGLIYLINLNDKEKALKFIKEAAFNEYPPAQSNYAFLLQNDAKDHINAEYYLKKASKKNFPIAEYNLGYLYEVTQKFDKAIQFYTNASDHENEPFIFQGLSVYDYRLNVSKTFIVCLTNLKLTQFYLSRSNFEYARKYFKRALSKILSESSDLPCRFTSLSKKEAIKSIKKFILNCPLFNLVNQPNLKHINLSKSCNYFNEELIEMKQNEKENNLREMKQICLKSIEVKNLNQKVIKDGQRIEFTEFEQIQNKNVKKIDNDIHLYDNNVFQKIILNHSIFENLIENKIEKKIEKEEKFRDLDELFDFIIHNKNLISAFNSSINDTISDMKKILYQPPFQILFGAIILTKPKIDNNENENLYSLSNCIDESFYEGLGVDI